MTGELLSVVDGRFITEARTAAVSAVIREALARKRRVDGWPSSGRACRPGATSRQSVSSADLAEVRVWSPHADNRAPSRARCSRA